MRTTHNLTAHDPVCFNRWEIYAILLPILILLTFLPSFKLLAYAAYIGSIFLVVAMIVRVGGRLDTVGRVLVRSLAFVVF